MVGLCGCQLRRGNVGWLRCVCVPGGNHGFIRESSLIRRDTVILFSKMEH